MVRVIFFIILITLNACSYMSGEHGVEPSSYPSIKVRQLTTYLTQSLSKTLQNAKDKGLEIRNVKITLNTVLSDNKEGSLSVLVFEGSASKKKINTTTFVITLEKIEEVSSKTSVEGIDGFVNALDELVKNADSYTIGSLKASEIKGTLKFAVEKTKKAEVGKEFEIVPVGLSAAQTISDANTQTIEITFKKASNAQPKAD